MAPLIELLSDLEHNIIPKDNSTTASLPVPDNRNNTEPEVVQSGYGVFSPNAINSVISMKTLMVNLYGTMAHTTCPSLL